MLPRMALLGLLVTVGSITAHATQPVTPPAPHTETTQPATVVPLLPEDPWSSEAIVAPRMNPPPTPARPLPRKSRPIRPPASATRDGRQTASWFRTTASLGGVVALIVLLAWGYRTVAKNGGRLRLPLRGRQPSLIEVVGRTSLSPRQSLCLVRIGPRLVLLGLTNDAVRALDVIDDAALTAQLMGQATQSRPDSHTASFNRCLEHAADEYGPEDGQPDETVTPPEDRIIAIKEQLASTIQRLRAKAAQA